MHLHLHLRIRLLLLAALSLSAGVVLPAESESAYNQGVHAYQAKDYAKARVHWARAVEQNVRPAYNNLGYLLFYGLGGAEDAERAVSLWTTGARRGEREAQWHLAHALEDGKGVARDIGAAYAWYRCADVNFASTPPEDDADTIAMRDIKAPIARLIATMSPEQLRDSEIRARQLIAASPYVDEPAATRK